MYPDIELMESKSSKMTLQGYYNLQNIIFDKLHNFKPCDMLSEHPQQSRWLTKAQAAKYLNICNNTLTVIIQNGDIRPHRINDTSVQRFDIRELDKYLEEC